MAKMKESGLHNVFRIADYGLHMYYNIPALVGKVPLSPAGNPWSLAEKRSKRLQLRQGGLPDERRPV